MPLRGSYRLWGGRFEGEGCFLHVVWAVFADLTRLALILGLVLLIPRVDICWVAFPPGWRVRVGPWQLDLDLETLINWKA